LGNFPAAVVSNQWKAASDVRLFSPENLYEKINGEAPKFLLQGFERLYYLVLRQKDLEISI
jgi:hypothetical protein